MQNIYFSGETKNVFRKILNEKRMFVFARLTKQYKRRIGILTMTTKRVDEFVSNFIFNPIHSARSLLLFVDSIFLLRNLAGIFRWRSVFGKYSAPPEMCSKT